MALIPTVTEMHPYPNGKEEALILRCLNIIIMWLRKLTGAINSISTAAGAALPAANQGAIYHKGAADVEALAPGTATYLLQTNGAAANPTWVTPPVTLPAANQGAIWFKGAAAPEALAPSTDTYVLTTHGAAANPTWAASGAAAPVHDPTPDVTVGTTAETEAAQTDDWDVGDGSLAVVMLTRMAYDPAGGAILYGYYRTFSYEAAGRLTKVTTETRVAIETPVLVS